MGQKNTIVKRYTTLSSALETLCQRKLVLLSPSKWDDSNDSFFMELYRDGFQLRSVVALCFTMAEETYHHWRVFTQGIEGVCIEFQREPLERFLNERSVISAGAVKYVRTEQLQLLNPKPVAELPFIKGKGYKDENEWRVIAGFDDDVTQYFDIGTKLIWINRIVLNPWMPPSLVDNTRYVIQSLPECSNLRVDGSSLTNSEAWKDAGKRLANIHPRSDAEITLS